MTGGPESTGRTGLELLADLSAVAVASFAGGLVGLLLAEACGPLVGVTLWMQGTLLGGLVGGLLGGYSWHRTRRGTGGTPD